MHRVGFLHSPYILKGGTGILATLSTVKAEEIKNLILKMTGTVLWNMLLLASKTETAQELYS